MSGYDDITKLLAGESPVKKNTAPDTDDELEDRRITKESGYDSIQRILAGAEEVTSERDVIRKATTGAIAELQEQDYEPESNEPVSWFRQLQYGLAKGNTDIGMGMDLYSIHTGDTLGRGKYGPDFSKLTPDERRERIKMVDTRAVNRMYRDVIAQGAEDSGWVKLGEFAKSMVSPLTLVGAPAKLAAWGGMSLARNLGVSAVMGGSFAAEWNLLEQLSQEGEVDPKELAMVTAAGAAGSPVLMLGLRGAYKGIEQVSSKTANKYAKWKTATDKQKRVRMFNNDVEGYATQFQERAAVKLLQGVPREKVAHELMVEDGLNIFDIVKAQVRRKKEFYVPTVKEAELSFTEHGMMRAPSEEGVRAWMRDTFVPAYDIVRDLAPRIYGRLINFEHNTHQRISKYSREVFDLTRSTKFFKETADKDKFWNLIDLERWDEAFDHVNNTRYLSFDHRSSIIENLTNIKNRIEGLGDEAVEVGMFSKSKLIENYFPKKIRDLNGLMYAMTKSMDTKDRTVAQRVENFFSNPAAMRKDAKAGRGPAGSKAMSPAERAQWWNQFLRGHKQLDGINPSWAKDRHFVDGVPRKYEIDPKAFRNEGERKKFFKDYSVKVEKGKYYIDLRKNFYESPEKALEMYVRQMTDEIEVRKFFGRDKLKSVTGKNIETADELDLEETIGAFLDAEHQAKAFDYAAGNTGEFYEVLKKLMRHRFLDARTPVTENLKVAKEVTMATLLGNPYAAITQIGDLGNAVYRAGLRSTTKTALRRLALYIPNLTGWKVDGAVMHGRVHHWKNRKELDEYLQLVDSEINTALRQSSYEIEDQVGLSKWVNATFKLGFRQTDKLGKNIAIESALHKAMRRIKKNRTEWLKEYAPIFGIEDANKMADNIADVMTAMNSKKGLVASTKAGREAINQYTNMFLLKELADIQPVVTGLSSYKAQQGNNRYFYILGSFVIRQLGLIRRDVINEFTQGIQTGNLKRVGKSAKNLMMWGALAGTFNLGAYQIKHFMTHGELDEKAMPDGDRSRMLVAAGLQATKVLGISDFMMKKVGEDSVGTLADSMFISAPFGLAGTLVDQALNVATGDEAKWYKGLRLIPGIGRLIISHPAHWVSKKADLDKSPWTRWIVDEQEKYRLDYLEGKKEDRNRRRNEELGLDEIEDMKDAATDKRLERQTALMKLEALLQ